MLELETRKRAIATLLSAGQIPSLKCEGFVCDGTFSVLIRWPCLPASTGAGRQTPRLAAH
jgi:hypothetical protein